jgi:hypothetical protein
LETKRYEAEGFVEAATVRMHSNAEPAAKEAKQANLGDRSIPLALVNPCGG